MWQMIYYPLSHLSSLKNNFKSKTWIRFPTLALSSCVGFAFLPHPPISPAAEHLLFARLELFSWATPPAFKFTGRNSSPPRKCFWIIWEPKKNLWLEPSVPMPLASDWMGSLLWASLFCFCTSRPWGGRRIGWLSLNRCCSALVLEVRVFVRGGGNVFICHCLHFTSLCPCSVCSVQGRWGPTEINSVSTEMRQLVKTWIRC